MLSTPEQRFLLELALRSIRTGLTDGQTLQISADDCEASLWQPGAAFVTLERNGQLRGCIGSLEASRPLALDVVEHAFDAAFRDPRFPPLTASELNGLKLHISVLSPSVEIKFTSDSELLGLLRPGVDGLIIANEKLRATFLPSVWSMLPEPQDFLSHLKKKAGIPQDTAVSRAWRYTTQIFPQESRRT